MNGLARAALGAAAILSLCGAAGCGFGAGSEREGRPATLTVTSDFGHRRLASASQAGVRESDTVMRFLARNADVDTRYGGGFVSAINGVRSRYAGGEGRKLDWFYYVNGVEAPRGAAGTRLRPGDRVWWDYHDWSAAMRVPAVVGSYPEPFRGGTGGKRAPVRLDCAPSSKPACDRVADALRRAGVGTGIAALGSAAGEQVLRVVVGPWERARRDRAAGQIDLGPARSGVFARFRAGGGGYVLELLGPDGLPRAQLGQGAGLVAATAFEGGQPTWVVTGTDERGVERAAALLGTRALRDRFAVATSGERSAALPLEGAKP